jgi:hypothetical protein
VAAGVDIAETVVDPESVQGILGIGMGGVEEERAVGLGGAKETVLVDARGIVPAKIVRGKNRAARGAGELPGQFLAIGLVRIIAVGVDLVATAQAADALGALRLGVERHVDAAGKILPRYHRPQVVVGARDPLGGPCDGGVRQLARPVVFRRVGAGVGQALGGVMAAELPGRGAGRLRGEEICQPKRKGG